MTRFGVVGSRTFDDEDLLSAVLRKMVSSDDTVVSGGAKGADTLARKWADLFLVRCIEHLPDLPRLGSPAAYFARNTLIVEDSDVLIAFFGPDEPKDVTMGGTMDTVRKAIRKRIPVHLYFQR